GSDSIVLGSGGGTIIGGNGANPIVSPAGVSVSASEGLAFTVPVAAFIDSGNPVASNYSASINWGDNTAASVGTISINGNMVTVLASHTYQEEGSYSITVTL